MNGKTWRLLRSWYDSTSFRVWCGGALSNSFKVERGVKQGSLLAEEGSPVLCDQVNLATSVLEHVLEQHTNRLNLNKITALHFGQH